MSPQRRRIARKAFSEYLREASVLVGVFGLLDYLLKANPAEVMGRWWIVGTVAFSAVLFLVGLYFEFKSDEED
jgi:hypothetical protein